MKRILKATAAASVMAGLAFAGPAAAESVDIGVVTTLSTPAAVIGNDMKNGMDLAVEHLNGQMHGLDINIIYEDDEFNPETGKQRTDKLVLEDDVDFVTGFIWSHVLLASAGSVLDEGKILISANAGPSQLAGAECNENFFSTSWQNDQTPMALGEVLNQRGVESLYVMAPNYAAGQNMVAGVERTFAGEILGRDLTRWGADAQLDFSAELAKVRRSGAEGLFIFYPGRAGGAFMRQYQQAGLADEVPLYTVFTVDSISLPRFQEAGMDGVMGTFSTSFWSPDLDNESNRRFVADFRERYGRYPSHYAAQSYDSIMLINSAVQAVDGSISDINAVREGLSAADYASVRGSYTYGNNHFPIQNFYLREVAEDADGNWTTQVVDTVFENHQDTYASECALQ